MLPTMAFTGFAKRFRPPKADEGFQDITTVDFKVSVSDFRALAKLAR